MESSFVKGYFFFVFGFDDSETFSPSSISRLIASERELTRFSKRKSSMRVNSVSSRVINIFGFSVGMMNMYSILDIIAIKNMLTRLDIGDI